MGRQLFLPAQRACAGAPRSSLPRNRLRAGHLVSEGCRPCSPVLCGSRRRSLLGSVATGHRVVPQTAFLKGHGQSLSSVLKEEVIRSCIGQGEGVPQGPVTPRVSRRRVRFRSCASASDSTLGPRVGHHRPSVGFQPPSLPTQGVVAKTRLTCSGRVCGREVPQPTRLPPPRLGRAQAASLSCQSASECTWPGPSPGPRKATRHRPRRMVWSLPESPAWDGGGHPRRCG